MEVPHNLAPPVIINIHSKFHAVLQRHRLLGHAHNRTIKSDLEITYKENRIEEKCEVFYFDGVVNYALRNYVACPSKSYEALAMTLRDRVEFTVDVDDNGARTIAGDFHWVLPNRTVELLGKIRGELDDGRFDFF